MGLRSIKEIFVIGHGPSSSHTMGPFNAAKYILDKYSSKGIKEIEVTLYGSLALTGKGHLTDYIISTAFKDIKHNIIFDNKTKKKHPNTMIFKITLNDEKIAKEEIVSIGGGSIVSKDNDISLKEIYPHQHMKEIVKYCEEKNITLFEYVKEFDKANEHKLEVKLMFKNDTEEAFTFDVSDQVRNHWLGGVITVHLYMDKIPIPQRSGGSAFDAVVKDFETVDIPVIEM